VQLELAAAGHERRDLADPRPARAHPHRIAAADRRLHRHPAARHRHAALRALTQ
jgi:hypothetical protein